MSQLNIIATITIKPEYHEAFRPIFKRLVIGSRAEHGCVRYELNQSIENPNIYIVVETWQSQQAIDLHNTTPHFVEFANFAKKHVDGLSICIAKQVDV
ncbi:putative quinol monooxygenase [Gilliamella apis]|uniref:Antibiotic biosynthesis monooxygenase n=1 Tax=Gilliamella apis TaxID=1970738 RepID=A0A2V4DNI6_9GAMM|nr:putative quinol monooxygenase [Gilliamella apis]PXY91640.1 antibiotic biosynthesis monooxygenase [Gilliamella apis]WLS93362.1 putative quinol monooxygenase [Gilliamella apis]WLT05938.1 putative quinol monooxygenase [Gilliamella apis]